MAKKSRDKGENRLESGSVNGQAEASFLTEKVAVDPSLANLFASSVRLSVLLSI
jgi:hypothetical protein